MTDATKTYPVRYAETYEGIFSVEADSPEEAAERFLVLIGTSSSFGDFVSSHVELSSSNAEPAEGGPWMRPADDVDLPRDHGWEDD